VTDIIELTEEQKKAWASLSRAFKKCLKANVYFYCVLDTIHALNGDRVKDVWPDEEVHDGPVSENCDLTAYITHPNLAGFADDEHEVELIK
jgi:hypothetical protein